MLPADQSETCVQQAVDTGITFSDSAGRWRRRSQWLHNEKYHPDSYSMVLNVHAALDALGVRCHDCAEVDGLCHLENEERVKEELYNSDYDSERHSDEGWAAGEASEEEDSFCRDCHDDW